MKTIITARPDNMNFETYKMKRKEQTAYLRKRVKRGIIVYVASQYFKDAVGNERVRTFMPAIKTFDKYGNVKYVAMKQKVLKEKQQ